MPLRWILLLAGLFIVVLLAATLGAPVPFSDLWSLDPQRADTARFIFGTIRLPRVAAGLLVGASLATSGAALQAVFRNPLAEPYLLGISAGGALGATLATWLHLPSLGVFQASQLLAFVGALASAGVVYRLGQVGGGAGYGGVEFGLNRASLLLVGVALSAFLSALMSLIVYLSHQPELAQQVTFWLLGGLADVTPVQDLVLAICLVAGVATMLSSARDLNAARVGDEEALGLGVSLVVLHRRLLVASALMSAAAVAAAGLIGFVGLLAPHLMRLLFSSDARRLVPAAALGGALLLVGCDAVARSAVPPVELPVGIITALLGVPLFITLSLRSSGST